ncbi:unnamed protein product [Oppiella nova]|uniref:Piwi domain-containing protein n=1 Tax=Oppiella nova TaxID=334625 RepID=A0A7R9LYW5_9ACAR|nr:unnamed protein product [Oppiella nova]CAG2168342.1 unnamed protein product [Oppiella nova]
MLPRGGRGDGGTGRGGADHQRGRGGGTRGPGYGVAHGGGGDTPYTGPDVRTLCRDMTSLAIGGVATSRGTQGTPIQLIANHYRLEGLEDITCLLYEIDIRLIRGDGRGTLAMTAAPAALGVEGRRLRNDRKADNRQILDQMTREWPEVFADRMYAFDGQKYLYSGRQLALPPGAGQQPRVVNIQFDGQPVQTFEVRISFTKPIAFNVINGYFAGKNRAPSDEDFREAIQALEIVLRYVSGGIRVPIGRNLYATTGRKAIVGTNAEIAFGHSQAIQVTQTGLTLNVDRTATLILSAGSLPEFIAKEFRIQDIRRQVFDEELIQRVTKRIKGLKIYTNHIAGQKRRYFVETMTWMRPHDHQFPDQNGNITSVEQYFKQHYKTELELRNVPLIKTRGSGNTHLPVEVCHLYENQPMPKKLVTPAMTREIVTASNSQSPTTRFGRIQQSVEEVATESRDLMASFGMTKGLSLAPIRLTGRVLKAPTLQGSQNRVKLGQPLNRYLVFIVSEAVRKDLKAYFNPFFTQLVSTGREMGIAIRALSTTTKPPELQNCEYRSVADIRGAFKAAAVDTQMIFFVIPDVNDIYYGIKFCGDVEYGIPTQCILDKHLMSTPRGYFSNILLKINAKLNGQNQVLQPSDRPSAIVSPRVGPQSLTRRTMVVGVDVTHPGTNPLANERVVSSIAASVASYDPEFSKFMVTIAGQPLNTEIIPNYDDMFVTHLKTFMAKNNMILPQSVIVYRDGVSDGQFAHVKENEIPLIEKAFHRLNPRFEFKVTVFVVQKRHHTRFVAYDRIVNYKGKEQNIPAGTVVDHTITNPLHNEFHLCSHKGLLGTSRHGKYVCLRDDHNLSEDQKQQMSYYLCHTYCRSATPISIPTPVQYAHLAAYRAKQHIAAQNVEFEFRVRDETNDRKEEREARNIALLNDKVSINPKIILSPYFA